MAGGKVSILHERIVKGQKVTPIPRVVDNTSDLEAAALQARQQFAHINKSDDASGRRTRRGSLDSGNASAFSGTVVVVPTSGSTGSSGGA